MDYKTASMMRTFFSHMFKMNDDRCYYVAIVQDHPFTYPDDFSLIFFGGARYSSFLSELTTLAHAIESIVAGFAVGFCEYDAGTKKQELRVAVKIFSLSRYEKKSKPESSV